MTADDPSKNNAFINWFEGNVAMATDGTLYVPNDNFFLYAIDRATGHVSWRFTMPDQTWSLPAIDTKSGMLYVGNNNLLPALGKNTFAIDKTGATQWSKGHARHHRGEPSLLTPDGKMIVGGFDGYVRAYDAASGDEIWEYGTRDHIYASPARLPDGTIVQPSTDGTIYALDPDKGTVVWTYDTPEPVRASPAVDADGNVYVGLGEGRLLVLNKDGTLRWSALLITDDRDDLNASPALGTDAVYLGGESGAVFSVPYDFCLRPTTENDPHCVAISALPSDGAQLLFTTRFGALLDTPPAAIDANDAITLSLVVRAGGQPASSPSSMRRSSPSPRRRPRRSTSRSPGDGKFVTIAPQAGFVAGADGTVTISVQGTYLEGFQRSGLKLSGGTTAGMVSAQLTLPPSSTRERAGIRCRRRPVRLRRRGT